MLSKNKLESLLGRPLTSSEDTNRELYLNIAEERLKELICVSTLTEDNVTKLYDAPKQTKLLYINPLTAVTEVTLDDEVVEGYDLKQWDKLDADWYNVIVFDNRLKAERVAVTGTFGYGEDLPVDLQLLLANLFSLQSKEQATDNRVEQKSIEGFSVRYKDSTDYHSLVDKFKDTIHKYSQCSIGEILSGDTQHERLYHIF